MTGASHKPPTLFNSSGRVETGKGVATMGYRKSSTCVGRATGTPLTEYNSEAEAEEGAIHARLAYGHDLIPYHCQRCELWHLAPRARQTPSTTCARCTGADRQPKEAYETEDSALRRAEILLSERGIRLRSYRCPYGLGWHLTKASW